MALGGQAFQISKEAVPTTGVVGTASSCRPWWTPVARRQVSRLSAVVDVGVVAVIEVAGVVGVELAVAVSVGVVVLGAVGAGVGAVLVIDGVGVGVGAGGVDRGGARSAVH